MSHLPEQVPRSVLLAVTVPMSYAHWGAVPEALSQRGVAVTMVASELPTLKLACPRVNYLAIPMRRAISPLGDLVALAIWCRVLRKLAPDVIVAATPKAGMLAMLAARICRIPVRKLHVWGCRWDGQRGVRALLARWGDRVACASASEVIAVSEGVRALLLSRRITGKPVRLIGSGGSKGVDLERFSPRPRSATRSSNAVIGFAGRLARDKGLMFLPPMLRRVREAIPGAQLVLAGAPDEADPECLEIMRELRSMQSVRFVGETSDMPSFLRSIDVLCFPSLREGLPNVVIEAAACGVPTVGWEVTGLPDSVIDGETGYLVPLGDVAALSRRIVELLAAPELREKLGGHGREFVEARLGSRRVQGLLVDDVLSVRRS